VLHIILLILGFWFAVWLFFVKFGTPVWLIGKSIMFFVKDKNEDEAPVKVQYLAERQLLLSDEECERRLRKLRERHLSRLNHALAADALSHKP